MRTPMQKGKAARPALARLAIDTIKMLAVDAVEKAKSGHPGMPMGAAECAYSIWYRYLRMNPADPAWPNRDRFVLSAGHASMLLYGLLHLFGFDVTMDDVMRFRQIGSRTPGHPEVGLTPGVECTTGPLGQGFGNGVGMAIAERMLAARFNTVDDVVFDYRVFGMVSDGDVMEGVASEAASLAGHLGLSNLVYVYDDNRVTLAGPASDSLSEDVGHRFEGYRWFVQHVDGHDLDAIERALDAAVAEPDRPSLVVARTHIANGSPGKHDSFEAHGSPLGSEETAATKKNIGWPLEPTFRVPDEVRSLFADRVRDLRAGYDAWQGAFEAWKKKEPDKARMYEAMRGKDTGTPGDLVRDLVAAANVTAPTATRVIGGKMMQRIAERMPGLVGGSADLEPSTMTLLAKYPSIARGEFLGRNIHFGVREHGMGAICNGIALCGAFLPFGATFLVFSDYMRGSIRLAALSHLQVVYVFTHDSVLLGEDGPTHEPIEHVGALRLIPNLLVVRPADAVETAAGWTLALRRRTGPTALSLTRQKLPLLEREGVNPELALRGGYVLAEATGGPPEIVLIATGSEVWVAAEARKILEVAGRRVRLVSMPAPTLFDEQDAAYQGTVLPPRAAARRVSLEAGRTEPWRRWVGDDGLALGIDRYGASAPEKDVAEAFALTGPKVAQAISRWWSA